LNVKCLKLVHVVLQLYGSHGYTEASQLTQSVNTMAGFCAVKLTFIY